jgi:carboxymethylenebutenolidase
MFSIAPGRLGLAASLSVLLLCASCGDSDNSTSPATVSSRAGSAAPDAAVRDADQTAISVDTELLPYAEIGDVLYYGHFAFPSDMIEPLPAIVLIHDVWGLNDNIREMANRIAASGYMVLAVNLYGDEATTDVVEARALTIKVVEDPESAADNIRQALDFVGVAGAPGKAALGFGLGGTWSLNAAQQFPDQIDAVVTYYGQVTADEGRLAGIEAPVLGFFGAKDPAVSVTSVTDFEAAMRRLGKQPTVQIYSDVGHAFADPSRRDFDADSAADAWQRTMDFLTENLSVDDG